MALQTKIRPTRHYLYRVEVSERIEGKDIKYVNRTFDHIMKRVKRGAIVPRNGKKEGTYTVYFKGIVFVYSPHPDGSYTIITCYDRSKQTKAQLAQ